LKKTLLGLSVAEVSCAGSLNRDGGRESSWSVFWGTISMTRRTTSRVINIDSVRGQSLQCTHHRYYIVTVTLGLQWLQSERRWFKPSKV